MIGEAEIIVGAEVERLARRAVGGDLDARTLRPGDQPLALGQPGGVDLGQRRTQMGQKGVGHVWLPSPGNLSEFHNATLGEPGARGRVHSVNSPARSDYPQATVAVSPITSSGRTSTSPPDTRRVSSV